MAGEGATVEPTAEEDTVTGPVQAPRMSRMPNRGLHMGLLREEAKHILKMEVVGKPMLAEREVGRLKLAAGAAVSCTRGIAFEAETGAVVGMRMNVGLEGAGKPGVKEVEKPGVEVVGSSFPGLFPIQDSDFPLHSLE